MIVIIVQARMGSSRLPGKVLKEIRGRPMLSYEIERLRRAKRADLLVVATTTSRRDDAIVDLCASEAVEVTRGSEHDVLSRYGEAAREHGATAVVRVTADCPLIEPALVDSAIEAFASPHGAYDYVSNMLQPSWPYGMAVEVFSRAALDEAVLEAKDAAEREHVTPFLYWHPDRYRLKSLTRTPDLSHHRWTVDTPEDFEFVSRVIEALYPARPEFDMDDVLDLLEANPQLLTINSHVQQHVVVPTMNKGT
jgi:spore coat polysaccharide biosynthesis protein SpsF